MQAWYSIVTGFALTQCLSIIAAAGHTNPRLEIRLRDRNNNRMELIVSKAMHPSDLKHAIHQAFSVPEENLIFTFGGHPSAPFSPGDYGSTFGTMQDRLAATAYITVDSVNPLARPDFRNNPTGVVRLKNIVESFTPAYPVAPSAPPSEPAQSAQETGDSDAKYQQDHIQRLATQNKELMDKNKELSDALATCRKEANQAR